MTKIRVQWPKAANGNELSIHDWAKTLSAKEQQEWGHVSKLHTLMVDTAVSKGDAIRGVHAIDWKTTEIWNSYIDYYLPPEIKAIENRYWDKYLNELGVTREDIFGI
jgi:hypothetical protein